MRHEVELRLHWHWCALAGAGVMIGYGLAELLRALGVVP